MPIRTLPWRCSECGSEILLESGTAVVKSRVKGVDDGGNLITGQIELIVPRQIENYECAVCGAVLVDDQRAVVHRGNLIAYLQR